MAGLSHDEQVIVDRAARFGAEVIGPQAETWEKAGCVPREVFRQAAQEGLCRLVVPRDLGGLGARAGVMVEVMASLAEHCFFSSFALVVHNNLAGNIARNGSPEQIERYLPDLMAGHKVGAFLLTEPQGGSDAAAISTRAEKCATGWSITGEKAWVSNGVTADTLSVYAQTDPDQGARGIACFVIDAGAVGVHRKPAYELLGGHALGACGFEFSGCEVGEDAVLVPPGEGFRAAMQGIDFARIIVAASCCGMLQRALATAIDFGAGRHAFGQSVLDFQGIQWMLADVATDLEAARGLTEHAANLLDNKQGATLAAAHAKKFATRVALQRIGDCMQAMGAPGYSREYPLARHFAAAKMAQYLDGTTEIQNLVISRALRSTYGGTG
jgi:alkylation response protein AidB-like acyl-CoA dehydrogenase